MTLESSYSNPLQFIYESNLNSLEKHVYLFFYTQITFSGACNLSIEKMARLLSISDRQLHKIIKFLCDNNLLEKKHHFDEDGRQIENTYSLI